MSKPLSKIQTNSLEARNHPTQWNYGSFDIHSKFYSVNLRASPQMFTAAKQPKLTSPRITSEEYFRALKER